MSIKQYNRGTAKLRRDTDNQQTAHRDAKSRRPSLARELDDANLRIARMENELLVAQTALEEAQAQILELTTRSTTAEAEALAVSKKAESYHRFMMDQHHALQDSRKAHNKLSRIMRLALTPTQYHYYRQEIEDMDRPRRESEE